MDRARESANNVGIVGFGVIELRNPLGHLTYVDNFTNIVTTAGDLYYAAKAVTNIGTPNAAAPTAANGMKLGSGGGTTPTKSSTQAALVTYISGSNLQFDAAFPDVVDETGDTGASARYKCTWGAGVVTNSDIDEVVIVNDRATDATSTAANTYSRAIFTSINKTSSDSLAITWKHLFLGA
jgi:hypothetical protein